MKIVVAAVGRLKSGPEFDLAERYARRARQLARRRGISDVAIIEIPESGSGSAKQRCDEEATRLLRRLPDNTTRVLLDERGDPITSRKFADIINRARDDGADLAFLLGGPDGHGASARAAGHRAVSFGAMTLPHQLARVLVLEQVYRAMTIVSGHPYHRD